MVEPRGGRGEWGTCPSPLFAIKTICHQIEEADFIVYRLELSSPSKTLMNYLYPEQIVVLDFVPV